MGAFDDAMKNAVPGGNLATPIAVAVGALLLGKFFGGGSAPAPAPAPSRPTTPPPVPTNVPATSVLGGLGDLIGKLTAGGAGPAGQFLGRPRRKPAYPAGTARLGARPEYAERTVATHRHEPAGTFEPARDRAAAAHQSI